MAIMSNTTRQRMAAANKDHIDNLEKMIERIETNLPKYEEDKPKLAEVARETAKLYRELIASLKGES